MKKRWAVGNVRTGHELPVAERIEALGVEVYCPKATRTVRKARKRRPEEVEEGALPGYLFVNPETIEDPEEVYQDPGFHYFLLDINKQLATVLDATVEAVRTMERLGGFVECDYWSGPRFARGEVVRVPDGPYKGYLGVVVDIRRGYYFLDGEDFVKPVWFEGLKLLAG